MDTQILAALQKFHDIWPRVGGKLEVANKDYVPPRSRKTAPASGRRLCGMRLLAALALLLMLEI